VRMGLLIAMILICIRAEARANDIAGAWTLTGEVAGHDVELDCIFAGAAGGITARCGSDGDMGPATATMIADRNVTWKWDAGLAVLTFKGVLESDTSINGAISVAGVTGTFAMTKQPSHAPAKEKE